MLVVSDQHHRFLVIIQGPHNGPQGAGRKGVQCLIQLPLNRPPWPMIGQTLDGQPRPLGDAALHLSKRHPSFMQGLRHDLRVSLSALAQWP